MTPAKKKAAKKDPLAGMKAQVAYLLSIQMTEHHDVNALVNGLMPILYATMKPEKAAALNAEFRKGGRTAHERLEIIQKEI